MAGNREGGLISARKNLARDPDFYKRIGSMGGKAGAGDDYRAGGERAMGFATNPERARLLGAIGGRISKRRPMTDNLNKGVQSV